MLEGNKWNVDQFDFTTLLIDIASRGVDIFLTGYVTLDSRNVSRRLIEFDQGDLGLGDYTRDYYLDREQHGKKIAAYRQFLISMVQLFHIDASLPINERKIASDVDEIIGLETELAKILVPEEDRRNFTKMYNLRRFSDMQTLMPLVDWARYFHFVAPFVLNNYLANDPQILITEIDYMRRVTELIKSTDPRIVTNYAYLRYSSSWGGELGERFEDIYQNKQITKPYIPSGRTNCYLVREYISTDATHRVLDKLEYTVIPPVMTNIESFQFVKAMELLHAMYGRENKPPRWKICTTSTMNMLNYATGALYVKKAFNEVPIYILGYLDTWTTPSSLVVRALAQRNRTGLTALFASPEVSKNVTLEMINNLQDAFLGIMVENDWMDERTKVTAIDKARHMLRQIGYPDFILDDEKLDNYYDGLCVEESDSYSQMMAKVTRWGIDFQFKRLMKPVDRNEFDFNPAIVNAYYSSTSNSISEQAQAITTSF
ncbi:hypothetical protein KIN20_013410 [Parelaphostrongylus tenuis]|uniref:Peptidase M13 N-terminal domain-containing protein n=1 Tax=Parelaphostrongylus tenuis TaxID=148309 RepID=A0AAD5MY26_PARTN|nr:hypothetical protein KIN20_013410 [Parelaphostrongylus tenuis]